MPIFKPKKGPLLQWSRVVHFLIAATVTGCGGHLGGYRGSIWIGAATIAGGLLWEISNRYIPRGGHPYGDAADFWSFVIGAVFGGLGYVIVRG